MASFLRGKQAGIQNDLSAGILPGLFAIDDQARFGVNSQISALAYDPVQSLLAVGTNESPYGSGQIYVYGQKRVQQSFLLPRHASIRFLQFCADRLISIDSKNEVIVWDLQQSKRLTSYAPPGVVAALVTDPMLDWAFIGLQSGDVIAYDLDRERLAPLRLPNFWKLENPKSRRLGIVCMQLHPRDIGQLLIGYMEGAVIYSFKQNKPIKFFRYELPAGAPGGGSEPSLIDTVRHPGLTHAIWHPTGTFILTGHDDGSLVTWDLKDGRVLMARTITDTNVNKPGASSSSARSGAYSLKAPLAKIAWCAKDNPDDTGILVAGGISLDNPEKGLTFLELGPTPVYATTPWQALSDHFLAKRQHSLKTPPGAEVVNFCLIPRVSPHFAGAQDPIAIIALLSSGEIITLSFPSGHPISPTNFLHPSLAFVHPFVTSLAVSPVERTRWLGMTEKRQQGPPILRGGVEGTKPMRRYEARNIVQMAHGDGTIRIFDAGHADELENDASLQVDVARALGRFDDIDITLMSMASVTGELAVGLRSGEVVIYRWGGNTHFGRDEPGNNETVPGGLTDISDRCEPSLKLGLQPYTLYDMDQGPISALKLSDVGFVGIGSENGVLTIIDLRGPTVIYTAAMSEFIRTEKRRSFIQRSSSSAGKSKPEWPIAIEFGVLTLDGDDYSSICCFVGTNLGRLATFKILPEANGGYTAVFVAATMCNDRIIAICPIIADNGRPANAHAGAVAGLRRGEQINGTLVVVTEAEVRIFKPASSKGAQKSWDDFLCDAACVTEFEMHGFAIVGVFGDGTTRAFSLPALKEIGCQRVDMLDTSRISSSIVTRQGDIFGWTGPSEIAMCSVWGTGQALPKSQDKLFNPQALIPPRPTISNLQWIAGTQYVSPTDLDLLIGGPDRPPSKRMMEATAEEERHARLSSRGDGRPDSRGGGGAQEGWGDYMTRQLNERTERLNIMGDSMEKAQENSAGLADDVSKYVGKQKRNIVLKGITNKFF